MVFDGADILGITYSVLGPPGRDNALLVQVDSGQATEKLLFDCGEGCLAGLSFSDLQAVDHLFFPTSTWIMWPVSIRISGAATTVR